jgi:hypothetical protein
MMPLIVSHYTVNTGYADEIKKLRDSLDYFGLENIIEGIKSLGSWRANSNYCAVQVMRMLDAYPDRDILRVDADAIFQRYPVLFEESSFTADIAAHVHNFRWHPYELLGGTLFFRNTESVRKLVACWAQWCTVTRLNERPGDLLQILIGAVSAESRPYIFGELPATYCKIFDLMKDVKDPVIEHFQASRRFKRVVNMVAKATA